MQGEQILRINGSWLCRGELLTHQWISYHITDDWRLLEGLADAEEECAAALVLRPAVEDEAVIETNWNEFDFDAEPDTGRLPEVEVEIGNTWIHISYIYNPDTLKDADDWKPDFVVEQE